MRGVNVLKKFFVFLLAAVMVFSLVACSNGTEPVEQTKKEKVESKVESKGTQYPITVKDASGTDVQFDKEPQRIVSISPAETEVLFALGLGEQVVGVTEWCDYPAEAKAKAKVGDMNSNMEAILALNPDVIIGGYTLNAEAVKKLRELGKRVFTVEPKTIDQVMERILQVGTITNRQTEAKKVVLSMKEKRQQVIDAVVQVTDAQKQKIYLEFDAMWTVGKGEFGDDLIRLSGAKNIARDKQGWVQINDEFIITQNPGVIIYASYTQDNAVGEAIKKRSGWSAIEAVKQNRVIGLDANMISRPGPRITDGLFEIAKGVYPELVK
jgi:iron complex transport system substrate-binding protein